MSKNQTVLPKIYTQEIWERYKNPHNKKYIGKHYISWSQIESFNDKSGFNTGLLGEFEYILGYFLGIKFPDLGWGDFGSEAEAYITLRDKDVNTLEESDKNYLLAAQKNFTPREKETLEKIKPLGIFQDEICYYVEELDVIVLGYTDDRTPEINGKIIKLLRDYKTKSQSSKKDLHLDKKHQIELYVLGYRQQGLEVENAEYCIIERLGGKECFNGGGRESLSVGKEIWYEPYSWDEERLKDTHKMIVETVKKISSLYSTYLKIFG
jgi:hypothetical protein